MMKTITLNNDLKIPAIGLGTWKSAPGEVGKAVTEAIKAGYRHIDCAFIYRNEAEIGEALKKVLDQGIVKREELWITSKLWNNAHEKDRVIPALEQTLADLQLNYLDLYLIHWPVAFKADVINPEKAEDFLSLDEAPIAATWDMMEQARDKGLVKSIGVSNFSIKKLTALLEHCRIKPVMNQVEMHPYLPQNELLEFCSKNGIVLTGYSPLGSGDRPEGMKKDNEPTLLDNPAINAIARKHQCTPAQVLISWQVHRDCAVIPKSTNPERLRQNLESSEVHLEQEDMEAIASIDTNYRFVDGKFFEFEGNTYRNVFDL